MYRDPDVIIVVVVAAAVVVVVHIYIYIHNTQYIIIIILPTGFCLSAGARARKTTDGRDRRPKDRRGSISRPFAYVYYITIIIL